MVQELALPRTTHFLPATSTVTSMIGAPPVTDGFSIITVIFCTFFFTWEDVIFTMVGAPGTFTLAAEASSASNGLTANESPTRRLRMRLGFITQIPSL